MRLYSYLVLFCLLISFSASAQRAEFEAGYVVTTIDTIRGFLLRTDEVQLGQRVKFKESETSEVYTYSPTAIESFSFDKDGFNFHAVEFTLRQNNVVKKTQRFAKVLLKGFTSLYKLQLGDTELKPIFELTNNYVYILQKNNIQYTLGQYESMIDRKHYRLNKQYIGMLTSLTSDCSSMKISDRLGFEDAEIINIVRSYNDCIKPNAAQSLSYKVKMEQKHGIIMSYGTVVNFNYKNNFSNASAPSIGYFWDIANPSRSRTTSFVTGFNYMHLSYLVPIDNIKSVKINEHYLKLPIVGQRNYYSKRNAVPFINFGVTLQASTDYGFNYLDLVPFVDLGVGVYIKKFRLSLLFENSGIDFNADKILSFGLGYRLDKLKN